MNKKKQNTEITCNEFASRYNKKIKHVFFHRLNMKDTIELIYLILSQKN